LDVDLGAAKVAPNAPRVVVDGHAAESGPKTDSGYRWLALDPVTHAALASYLETWAEERRLLGQRTDLLFVWPDGRPLHPDTITALFSQARCLGGLPKIRLHDVRHSYATAALKAGISPKAISERLGHSTAAFTLQVYSHVTPGMDEQAANTVATPILYAETRGERPDVRDSVRPDDATPLESKLTWARAQVSASSGGRI
jgi:integrase